MNCKCYIGIINDYENTRMTTLYGLKLHIKESLELKQAFETDPLYVGYNQRIKGWTLADYWVKIKTTDFIRF